jgi:protein-disulfide isomerase
LGDFPQSKENRLIRLSTRYIGAAALITLFIPLVHVAAQEHVPPVPAAPAPEAPTAQEQPSSPTVPSSPAGKEPAAPAPAAPPTFPAPNPANFTATSPTKEVVNAFLAANWGYDENRMWQVQAILKTPVEGVSKVIVLIGDKTGKEKPAVLAFFVLPDGKHIITGDSIIEFGEHPFASARQTLADRANGPYRGSASKDFELVEFADFQCPHCKEAQANMDKLVTDYPKARIVFQPFPIPSIHPESMLAAEYGDCISKMAGSSAFFQFASAVFDGQEGLATPDGTTLTLNSAVTKAGLDPTKVATCAATPESKADVEASIKLGTDLGVNEVPMLMINGRQMLANVPYNVLKKVIDYQMKADGVSAQ